MPIGRESTPRRHGMKRRLPHFEPGKKRRLGIYLRLNGPEAPGPAAPQELFQSLGGAESGPPSHSKSGITQNRGLQSLKSSRFSWFSAGFPPSLWPRVDPHAAGPAAGPPGGACALWRGARRRRGPHAAEVHHRTREGEEDFAFCLLFLMFLEVSGPKSGASLRLLKAFSLAFWMWFDLGGLARRRGGGGAGRAAGHEGLPNAAEGQELGGGGGGGRGGQRGGGAHRCQADL